MKIFDLRLKRCKLDRIFIFFLIGIFCGLTIRVICGSSHIFYAYNCSRGLFPSPHIYTLMYFIKCGISTTLLGCYLFYRSFLPNRLFCFFTSIYSGIIVYAEYNLLIVNENFLSMITLILASVIMLYKTIKENCWIRNYIRIITWILIILQSMSVYFIVSLII